MPIRLNRLIVTEYNGEEFYAKKPWGVTRYISESCWFSISEARERMKKRRFALNGRILSAEESQMRAILNS